MREDPRYESWKQARAKADVPAGFADRVMERAHAHHRRNRLFVLRRVLLAVAMSRLGKVAIWSVALTAFALRIGTMFLLLIPR